jgi:hypothetical protein
VEVYTGHGTVDAVNHALEVDGFFSLAVDSRSWDRTLSDVRGIRIVTDDAELDVVVPIGAVQAQRSMTLVALCNIHDSPAVLGYGVRDREAFDDPGYRHAHVEGAWNRLNRRMAFDRNCAAARYR